MARETENSMTTFQRTIRLTEDRLVGLQAGSLLDIHYYHAPPQRAEWEVVSLDSKTGSLTLTPYTRSDHPAGEG